MHPARVKLEYRKGDVAAHTFTLVEEDGNPFPLDDYSDWAIDILPYEGAAPSFSSGGVITVTANEIALSFDGDADFAALDAEDYVYELYATKSGQTDETDFFVGPLVLNPRGSDPPASTASSTQLAVGDTAVTVTITQTVLPFQATIKVISASTYTLIASDAGKHLRFTQECVVTIPPYADVPTPEGTTTTGDQKGAGQVTFEGGSGVTVNGIGTTTIEQFSPFMLLHTEDQDTWLVSGNVS